MCREQCRTQSVDVTTGHRQMCAGRGVFVTGYVLLAAGRWLREAGCTQWLASMRLVNKHTHGGVSTP
jgi:hypothetical protein